jgi:excisionase family DNA binding protein
VNEEAEMDNRNEGRLLLRPAEASEALGIGRALLYELISSGDIPVVRVGHRYRVPVRALQAWIEAQTETTTSGENVK